MVGDGAREHEPERRAADTMEQSGRAMCEDGLLLVDLGKEKAKKVILDIEKSKIFFAKLTMPCVSARSILD
jgi:hypothetical protein